MKTSLFLASHLSLFVSLSLLHYTQPLFAQGLIVINEVLYDPTGTNAGNQVIELKNVGTAAVNLNGWWFCSRQDYSSIPVITIDPGNFLVVHVGATGTDTQSDIFLPAMPTMQTLSDLNLYLDANFDNAASMVDFVMWAGVSPTGREAEAVTAGEWTAGEFVPAVAEGHSISYDGNGDAAADWYDDATPTLGSENDDITTGIEDSPFRDGLFSGFALLQNYPNPFNPSTVIEFSIPNAEHVLLRVYDIRGTEIATLSNRSYNAGTYRVAVNASAWSSGVYFYRLHTGGFSKTMNMLLIK